jgi:hypothetical protein
VRDNMAMKKWEEYSKKEQTNYLTYWFHHYGNILYTLQELEDFGKLASTRQDDIFNHIVTEFIFKDTIQSGMLLAYMRENKIEELFEMSLTKEKVEEVNKEGISEYNEIRDVIVKEIIGVNEKDTQENIKNTV